jgi:outer membrane protein OmpA-like peptidoglycan-associated protein
LIIILLIGCIQLNAQEVEAYSNANLKFLASEAEARKDYLSAAIYFDELSRRKPKNDKFKYQLARNYQLSSQFDKAANLYQALKRSDYDKEPLLDFYLGRILIMQGKCAEAIEVLDQFRKDYRGEKDDRKYRRMAKFSIEGCDELEEAGDRRVVIDPLPAEVNGANMEGAAVFLDENEIIYSSLHSPAGKAYDAENLELPYPKYYRAKKQGGNWSKLAEWKNIDLGDGYYPVSAAFNSQKSRIYISGCKDLHSRKQNCDIFRGKVNNGKVVQIERLAEGISTSAQERHPAVGIDEKGRETLYFVSDREEGKGGFDIWYSTYYEKKDEYREARNAGSKLNSVGDELSPYIDAESGEFYFSSDAHPGYGGLDVFRSVGARSKWKEPENLGSEINGPMDELYYVLAPSGKAGIFASNRQYEKKTQPCCDDLFYFIDPKLVKLMYSGKVKNEDGEPLAASVISIYEKDDSTGESYLRKSVMSDDQGEYRFRLEPDKHYLIKASQEDYFTVEKEISTEGKIASEAYEIDLSLQRMDEGPILLGSVFYEFNSAELTQESKNTLDTTFYQLMIKNPQIIVEVSSHTDSKGQANYNMSLSQRRANAVINYLMKKGIDRKRLKAKGYGETKPIAPNKNPDGSDNPEGRAKNRRTEFQVIDKMEVEEDD